MTPKEYAEWLNKATLQELVNTCIWDAVMAGTAHCGWTERAREQLILNVQENVLWALGQKLVVNK